MQLVGQRIVSCLLAVLLASSHLATASDASGLLEKRKNEKPRVEPDPISPPPVWRGEHDRTPEEVEKADGFIARGFFMEKTKQNLTPEQREMGASLYYHTAQDTAEFTQYVSTTKRPMVAFGFATQHIVDIRKSKDIYMYKIHQDTKMIDVDQTLGEYKAFSESELSAIGGIPFDQIMGWIKVTADNLREVFDAKGGIREDAPFVPNPKYNAAKYHGKRASGSQPQLAGFPEESPAWQEKPWAGVKTKSTSDLLRNFVWTQLCRKDTVCIRERWPRAPRKSTSDSALDQAGHDESPSTSGHKSAEELCKRDASSCMPTMFQEPEPVEIEKPMAGVEEGSPESAVKISNLPKSEKGYKPKKVQLPAEIHQAPDHKLIKGLGYLRAAQILTSAVDAAASNLRSGAWDHIKSDVEHGHLLAALRTSGSVLMEVANDTIPGVKDIEQHLVDYHNKVADLARGSMADAVIGTSEAAAELVAKTSLTIFENYMPGVQEIMTNAEKEYKEYAEFKGNENAVQKAARVARLVTKGAVSTLDDVFRNWVPGYREAIETAEDQTRFLAEDMKRYHDNQESLWSVIMHSMATPVELVTGTLHRVLRDYVPGEKLLEEAVGISPPREAAAGEAQTDPAVTGKSFADAICRDGDLNLDLLPEHRAKSIHLKCERLANPKQPFAQLSNRIKPKATAKPAVVAPPRPTEPKHEEGTVNAHVLNRMGQSISDIEVWHDNTFHSVKKYFWRSSVEDRHRSDIQKVKNYFWGFDSFYFSFRLADGRLCKPVYLFQPYSECSIRPNTELLEFDFWKSVEGELNCRS